MKAAIALCLALCACVNAGLIAPVGLTSTLVRAPAHDSAIIKSDRLGGNFAYSTAEAHAYAQITPVVQNVVSPIGVSYQAHAVPIPAVSYGYLNTPLIGHAPIAFGPQVAIAQAPLAIESTLISQDAVKPVEDGAPAPAPAVETPVVPAEVASDDSDSVSIDAA